MIFPFFKKAYHPLNIIRISRKNLLHNYEYLAKTSQSKIAPVLKSNAYGHGIVEVAKILDNVGAPFFCVDGIHEGYQLTKAHIKTPILIMGYIAPENLKIKKLSFAYAVYSEEQLLAIKKYQPHARIHIFVDTGMHREGVLLKDLPSFLKKAQSYGLSIQGLMSHFAMADKPNSEETKQQVKNFIIAQKIFRSHGIQPKYTHIAASSGVLHGLVLGNVSRGGIALYGIDPEGKNRHLRPVLALTTTIVQIKTLQKGDCIGYDFTYTAKKPIRIAILPIGYNDGVNRKLSNKGYVKVGKKFCPIIGRVSMNITIVDINSAPEAKVGNEVIIYSNKLMDKNSVQGASKASGVIPYEVLVQLHTTTRRVII